MANIGTTLAIYDQMSAPLNNIRGALEKTMTSFDALQDSANSTFDDSSYQEVESSLKDMAGAIEHAEKTQYGLNSAMEEMATADVNHNYDDLNRKMQETEDAIKKNNEQQQKFTDEVDNSTRAADLLKGAFFKISGALAGGKFLKGGLDRLMGVDTAQAKLTALGHSAEGVAMITNNALDSVTGTSFRMEEAVTTAASAVAAGIKPGMELERYLSLTGDTAAIAGASMQEMGAIFNKITTSGRIQAQELNQMGDRGIPIIQMLAEELGVAADEVRELASAGEISSQQFLNAVESGFGGAAKIMGELSLDAVIDNIGASLGRMSANFLNGANDGKGFFDTVKPLLVDLLDWMRSVEGYFAIAGQVMGQVFSSIITLVSNVANAFTTYWGIIQPILWGVIALLIVYNSTMGIAWAITMKEAVAKMWSTAATWAQTVATFVQTAAQHGLNAALAMGISKWMFYAMVVIALVAIFYAVVAAINYFTGSAISATGLITGAFAWMGALIMNILIAIVNTGIITVNLLINVFQVGIWLIQMAFIGLITLVLLVFDGIIISGIYVAEILADIWNISIYLIQMGWIGLNILVRSVLQGIINAGISAAETVANTWNDGVYGMQMAWYMFQKFVSSVMQAVGQGSIGVVNSVLSGISTLVNSATSGLNTLIGMANKIPGVEISTIGTVDFKVGKGVQGYVDSIGAGISAPSRAQNVSFGRSTLADDYSPNVPNAPESANFGTSSLASDFLGSINMPEFPKMEAQFDTLDFVDMGSWFDKGYDWGENMADKVKDFSITDALKDWLGIEGIEGMDDFDSFDEYDQMLQDLENMGKPDDGLGKGGSSAADKAADSLGNIADNTDAIKNNTGASKEDLKYLRDLNARNFARKAFQEININLGGVNNTVNNEQDLDGVIDYIVEGLDRAVSMTAEGVHH